MATDRQTIAAKKLSASDISARIDVIQKSFLNVAKSAESFNFSKIELNDFRKLFTLYDICFFDRYFTNYHKGYIKFYLSTRMVAAAGKTHYWSSGNQKMFEIGIAISMLYNNFRGQLGATEVSGILCRNRLEAMMRVLEHEIVHVIEFDIFGWSDCKADRFFSIASGIFGHKTVTHSLMTNQGIAALVNKVKIGSQVKFQYEGRQLLGIVGRITKRATVYVQNPNGTFYDRRGFAYAKYLVPVSWLTPMASGPTDDPRLI